MVKKRKINRAKKSTPPLQASLEGFGEMFLKLEGELERTVRTVRKHGRQSGEMVMKNLDYLFETIGASEFKDKAVEKTEELTQELKNLVGNIKDMDINLVENPVVDAIKDNVSSALSRVQDLEVVEMAKEKVVDTKNQFFSLLNIPSQVDVDNLSRKIVALEKKVKSISKHRNRRSS